MLKYTLTSKAEFARVAGVSGAAVSQSVLTFLAPAMVGKKIDTQHPAAVAYLKKRGVEIPTVPDPPPPTLAQVLTPKAPGAIGGAPSASGAIGGGGKSTTAIGAAKGPEVREKKKRIESGESSPFDEIHNDMAALLDMPMRSIIEQFGVTGGLSSWIKDVKTIEEVEKTRIANAREKGQLVSRDIMERGVMVPIEKVWNQILRDGSQTISKRAVAIVLARDPELEIEVCELEVEAFVRDSLSGFIRMGKNRVRKTIRECKPQS
jgi:hypothetical protein